MCGYHQTVFLSTRDTSPLTGYVIHCAHPASQASNSQRHIHAVPGITLYHLKGNINFNVVFIAVGLECISIAQLSDLRRLPLIMIYIVQSLTSSIATFEHR